MDPIVFKMGVVTILLINVEEDSTMRPADLHVRVGSDGTSVQTQPEIRMNLYVLFVARFKAYEQGSSTCRGSSSTSNSIACWTTTTRPNSRSRSPS
jgi:hypothetical protein